MSSKTETELNLSQAEFRRDFELKDSNWFYKGMSNIWLSFLNTQLQKNPILNRSLDLGCGAGGKSLYLKNYSRQVFALDLSFDALDFCRMNKLSGFIQGRVEHLPYKENIFSLINMFDVLEHVDEDESVLREIHRILISDGVLVIALPAFQCLWSQHDIANFHKRRYSAGQLLEKLSKSGFRVKRISYVNFFLFPAVWFCRFIQYRMLRSRFNNNRTRVENLPGLLNAILLFVLTLESLLLKKINFPFGVGLLCVAQKGVNPYKMDRAFKERLVCPRCHGPLRLNPEDSISQKVREGDFICTHCSVKFPIIDGIPRFLSKSISDTKKITARNFGYSWKAFHKHCDFYSEQFWDWIFPVEPADIRGKVVLDAGCGNGRHIVETVKSGAQEVVGFDLSEAIDVAGNNTKQFKNVHLLQADIYKLPLTPVFDYIYCIGVLHHLPDPEKGFKCLVNLLKKGGRISVWVYACEGNWIVKRFIDPIRKHITSKMPPYLLYLISFPLACVFHIFVKYVIHPLNLFTYTKSFAEKFIPLNDYLNSISQFSLYANFCIVFDQLVAFTTHYIARTDIENWFKQAGLVDVQISFRNKNSWRGTGVKDV